MFDNYPNYDSINSDREREEKLMEDKRERCHKIGKLYSVLFWLTVLGTPIILVVSLVGGVVAGLLDSMELAYLVIGLISILALAAGVITTIVLFVLGKEESSFTAAGIAYILLTLFNTASEFLPEGVIKKVAEVLGLIAAMFYLFKFINGSYYILAGVDNYLASQWESLKKVILYFIIGIIACVILVIIPIIRVIALIALVIAVFGAIVVLIWEWVLMFKTARALKNF